MCPMNHKSISQMLNTRPCPFSIRRLNTSTYLIRENDKWGEYPHIYAKICSTCASSSVDASVIVLSDTGCGTATANKKCSPHSRQPSTWNLRTFLESTINPGGRMPYLVITTHCHYDHILGLKSLPSSVVFPSTQSNLQTHPRTTVLTSALGKDFVTPYSTLVRNSLCDIRGATAPHYEVGIWAEDGQHLVYTHPSGIQIDTAITILQTPGHTPDSLTWYDAQERLICVGDSFYDRESLDTRNAKWGAEPPMPTIFSRSGEIVDWWVSLKKTLAFVRERNEEIEESVKDDEEEDYFMVGREDVTDGIGSRQQSALTRVEQDGKGTAPKYPLTFSREKSSDTTSDWLVVSRTTPVASRSRRKQRVQLAAAHTTSSTDAETCILDVQEFMKRVLRDEVPRCRASDSEGEERWSWDDCLKREQGISGTGCDARFSLLAPLRLVEDARKRIPKHEWSL